MRLVEVSLSAQCLTGNTGDHVLLVRPVPSLMAFPIVDVVASLHG